MIQLQQGEQLGKYLTLSYVGAGAFGNVYLMRDTLMNREVAVKFVENQDPAAFVAHMEAQVLHLCRHERIVAINSVDVVQDAPGRHYAAIDMEYIAGGSAQRLIEAGHVTIRQSIKLVIDLLFALGHAHRQGVLHRDVKPSNLLLRQARAKLSDFGLAANASSALTASGAGSPVYCAPEVMNDDITSVRTDVFAAGMSLFQLANNIANFNPLVPSLDPIRLGRVIRLVGYRRYVPRRLRYICNKACAVDPGARYETADQMRQALEKLHVEEDWNRVGQAEWHTRIGRQDHSMTIEGSEMVYKVNGRRRNSNCRRCPTPRSARLAQQDWVYENTF